MYLYWIPLGAGTPVVQVCGKVFEALSAGVQRRRSSDLYHSALEVVVPQDRYIIEVTPIPAGAAGDRGVVGEGPVGDRLLGHFRLFRYEIRRWPQGVIPDVSYAVQVTRVADVTPGLRILDLVPSVPTLVWGRDELGTGDMWNSNSVTSWLLARAGVDVSELGPPAGGRAPGWDAGLVAAGRPGGRGPWRQGCVTKGPRGGRAGSSDPERMPTTVPMVSSLNRRQRTTGAVALAVAASMLQFVPSSEARPVPGAPSCPMTPADSFWHADVSALPVHAQSSTWVSSVGTTAGLKADFGSGTWNGGPIGIPYTTVAGTQAPVPVTFGYADESDPGPYPIPPTAPIEGGSASSGDRHVLVVDRDACRLWELYSAYPQNGGTSWTAGSGATWDLRSNAMRPLGWTSADAAGLPILPGLVRYDEVAAGEIDHVIRFTAPRTAGAYVWPASHKAQTGGASDPPMGAFFRLKAGFDISGFSAQNQVILRALKKHGMVLADNGSSWFMSGAPDPGWNDDDLNRLRSVPGSAFEAVDVSALKVSSTSYAINGTGPTTTTAPPATTTTSTTVPPASTNLVANPGFDANLTGWGTGDNGTSLVRTCTVAHSGACAAEIGRKRTTGTAVLDDSPNSVSSSTAGAVYAGSAWVHAPAGRSVTLRLREYRGSKVLRTQTVAVTASGSWQQVSVQTPPAAGGTSISVDVLVSLTSTMRARIDDVSLRTL